MVVIRSISCGERIGTCCSTTRGVSTRATGFESHHPRFTAVPNTPLRISRAFCRCRGVSNACSIYSAHSCGVMLRTRRRANPGHRLMNRRVKYRKSYTVRVRLSFRASNAASTAFSKVTVFSCFCRAVFPAVIHFKARFTRPCPATSAVLATIAASRIDIPVLRNMASAALSISVSFVFMFSWIRNPQVKHERD